VSSQSEGRQRFEAARYYSIMYETEEGQQHTIIEHYVQKALLWFNGGGFASFFLALCVCVCVCACVRVCVCVRLLACLCKLVMW